MGKKKDTSTEEDVNVDTSPHKKHKKHKHKKHKKRKERDPNIDGDDSGDGGDGSAVPVKPALKLKIKIGGKGLSQAQKKWPNVNDSTVAKVIPESASDDDLHIEVGEDGPLPNASAPSVDSDISDEDAWLEALESGKLDEYDEMKRMKDPAFMTKRQKALQDSKNPKDGTPTEHTMLPLGYKEKEMTEEMIQKKALRAKKRRQQAHEKREKDKKLTLDRLLKKHETKAKTSRLKALKKLEVPKITYLNNLETISLSFPTGMEFPLRPQGPKTPPAGKSPCGVKGCKNMMKYTCSKTKVPLCSLECYKKNLSFHKNIIKTIR